MFPLPAHTNGPPASLTLAWLQICKMVFSHTVLIRVLLKVPYYVKCREELLTVAQQQ